MAVRRNAEFAKANTRKTQCYNVDTRRTQGGQDTDTRQTVITK